MEFSGYLAETEYELLKMFCKVQIYGMYSYSIDMIVYMLYLFPYCT